MNQRVYELSIVGAGNMAEAIVRGILASGLIAADQMIAADPVSARRTLFTEQFQIKTVVEPVTDAKIVLLSVKPQQMKEVLATMTVKSDTLLISIAAGVTSRSIEAQLGSARVIRAMPNTPMLVGEGMTALCRGRHATVEDSTIARRLFETAGKVVEVEESQMDAVTAVSGSGPAYVFYLAEQMIAAGMSLGLSSQQSKLLALQTIAGAGKMLMNSSDEPTELRRKVTSPGGTTQAAIEKMDACGVGEGVRQGVRAAAERGQSLGK